MLFSELIRKIDIEKVISYIAEDESEVKYLDGYRKYYSHLLTMDPQVHSEYKLLVVKLKDYFEDEEVFSVYGYCAEDGETYAIEFEEWSKWLGAEVVEKSLTLYGENVFVGECFKEMTFLGFEESRIEDEKEELDRRVKDIEEGTANLLSFEEVLESLSEKWGEDLKTSVASYEPTEEDVKKMDEIKNYNTTMINNLVKD